MRNLNILIKPASSECNMNCSYCFYRDEAKYRQTYSYGIMPYEILEKVVKASVLSSEESCSFLFQGGEPTLAGLDFYKKAVEYQNKYKNPKIKIFNSIQTNGFAVDCEWCEFFQKNNFLVGLSLDGPEKIQGENRKDICGNNSFENVLNTLKLLKKHGINFSVLSVITDTVADNTGKIYRFFRKHGIKQIQFIPCLESEHTERKFLSAEKYGKFLVEIFDLWYDDLINGDYISIRHIENYIRILLNIPPEECGTTGNCNIQFVTEADGSIYPCDFYVTDSWRLGNINGDSFEKIRRNSIAEKFINRSLTVPEDCLSCENYGLCKNGCFRNREDGKNIYCKPLSYFFKKRKDKLFKAANIIRMRQNRFIYK